MNPARSSLIKILMAAGPFFAWAANADLQPFPLSANQQGTVACLANPAVSYSVYLPPGYSTNGTPLPIIYTENPSGGGMVSTFKTACSNLNIIAIGLNGYNGMGWSRVVGDYYLISGDVRQRVLFDPTAVFIGGFSGGGEMSYVLSRADASHVAGILPMAGWLGRYPATVSISPYCSVDRVLTNLLAARTTGTTDASSYYLVPDSNYLAACGAVVKDWSFSGGHAAAPSSVITSCLQWLVSQRTPTQPNDRSNSIVQTADWRVRMAAGQSESVLRERLDSPKWKPFGTTSPGRRNTIARCRFRTSSGNCCTATRLNSTSGMCGIDPTRSGLGIFLAGDPG